MSSRDVVCQLIASLDGNPDQRAKAQVELIQMGHAIVEPLVVVVKAEEGRKAWAAAEVLGELTDKRAWSALVAALRSKNPMLGVAAAKALLKYTDKDALPPLVDALPYAAIMAQQTIIKALQLLGDSRAVPCLVEQLGQAVSPVIRTALVQALGKLGDPSAIPAIRACLDDEDHHVREWSSVVLKQLEDQRRK